MEEEPSRVHDWTLADVAWQPYELRAEPTAPESALAALDAPLLPPLLRPRAPRASALRGRTPVRERTALICRVDGCDGLSAQSPSYYRRVRLCETHARAEVLMNGTMPLRLCQKCNRLQDLAEFRGTNRTCSVMLARHNTRRREAHGAQRDGLSAAASPAAPRMKDADAGADLQRSSGGDASSAALDMGPLAAAPYAASAVSPGFTSEEIEALDELLGLSAEGSGDGSGSGFSGAFDSAEQLSPHPPLSPPLPPLPPLRVSLLQVKLAQVAPVQVPWSGMLSAGQAMVANAFAQPMMALTAYVSPGCTLLSLEVLTVDVEGGAASVAPDAAELAAQQALLQTPGALGEFMRAQHAAQLLHIRCAVAGTAGSAPSAPLAALCSAPVTVAAADDAPADCLLRCRLHGQFVRLRPGAAGETAPLPRGGALTLPPTHCEGALMFDCGWASEVAPTEHDPLRHYDAAATSAAALRPPRFWATSRRPLLLTRNAAIVAEVAATEAALRGGAAGADAEREVHAALLAVGHALQPDCPPRLVALAAAAALRQRWHAAAARLLAQLEAAAQAAECEADGGEAADKLAADVAAATPGGVTLLHVAAATGDAELTALVLRAQAAFLGSAASAAHAAAGATPLHVAAGLPGGAGALVAELLTAGTSDAAADAVVAWGAAQLTTAPSSGVMSTPSDVARASGVPALRALDAVLRSRAAAGRAAAAAACDAAAGNNAARALLLLTRHAPAAVARGALTADAAAVATALLRRTLSDEGDAAAFARSMQAAALAPPPPPAPTAPPPAPTALSPLPPFALWRAAQCGMCMLSCTLCEAVYNALQARELATRSPWSDALLPPLDADGVRRFASWRACTPLWRYIYSCSLPLQVPATVLLLLPFLPGLRGRLLPLLMRHTEPVLVLQFIMHTLLCTIMCGLELHRAAPGAVVVWPTLLAVIIACCTLLSFVGWPLPFRSAAPVLALRAALPVVCHVTGLPVWTDTAPLGVAIQLAACALAARLVLRREAWMRCAYDVELAARSGHPHPHDKASVKASAAAALE